MEISKIEVSFARPVDLTDSEMHAIHNIVDDAARRTPLGHEEGRQL